MPYETDRPRRPAGSTTPASQPGILAQLDPMVQPQRACIIHARTNAQDHGPCTGYIYLPAAANNARRASRHRPRPSPSCAAARVERESGGTAARAGGRRPGHEGRMQKWQARRGANLELAGDVARARQRRPVGLASPAGRPAGRALLCAVLACHRPTARARSPPHPGPAGAIAASDVRRARGPGGALPPRVRFGSVKRATTTRRYAPSASAYRSPDSDGSPRTQLMR